MNNHARGLHLKWVSAILACILLVVSGGAGCSGKKGGGGGSGLPGAPGGLSATSGNALVSLIWSAVAGASTYEVKRSTTTGGPYATVATGITSSAYTDSGLTNGTTYFYVVISRNAAGTSGNSSQVSATPAVPLVAPAAPTGLAATPGDTAVSLIWNASAGASTYAVKRATVSGGPYVTIAAAVTGTVYGDTGLTNGTTYFYVVSATNVVGTSGNSAQASATPVAPVSAPAAPTGLTATGGNNQVGLTWNSVTGATTYNVKRATVSGGPYTTIATGVTVFTYIDNTAVNGTTYFYVVSAVNSSGQGSNSAQVTATPAVPTVVPAAPTILVAAGSNGTVSLSWNAGTDAASFTILRGTVSGGPYGTTVATGVVALTYLDNTVTNGTTYYYVVVAVNAAGNSPNSNQASATPTAPPPVPAAPTGLTATPFNTPRVDLAWTASTGAVSYTVKRATVTGGPYTTIASGVTGVTYSNTTSVLVNTQYFYVVSAVNGSGASPNSTEANALTPPAAPAPITVTVGNAEVQLSWPVVTGATSYTVRRGTVSGGPYGTVVSTGANNPFVVDNTVTNGTTYYYVVTALNAGGSSLNSAQASALPSAARPLAPTGITATANNTPAVVITWTAVAGATSYNLVRSSTSQMTGYTTLQNGVVGTTFTDSTALNNTTYWYTVQAVNASGTGAYGGPPPSALVPTVAPTALAATPTAAPQVNLTWAAPTGATSYTIRRGTVSGTYPTTVATGVLVTNYSDATVAFGTTYFYVVTASNGGVASQNSNEATALLVPGAPTVLVATPDTTPRVVLTWTGSTGAASYTVLRGTVSGGPYGTTVGTVAAPTVTINDTTVLNNGTYYYVVRATNATGNSANSTQATATVPTVAPTALTATATSATNINLAWTAAAGATSYTIRRGTTTGVYPTTVATGVAATTYSDATAAANTTYFYVVVAVNAGGNSLNSNEATDITPTVAPTSLVATPNNTPQVVLTWSATTGATSYTVFRGTTITGPYGTTVGTVTAPTVTINDNTVANNTTYFYVVQANNAGGASANSNEATATTPTLAATALVANAASTTQINLGWVAAAGATSYTVMRGTSTGVYGTTVATNVLVTSYNDTGLTAGTPYFYVVIAVNAGGNSVNSNEAATATLPAAPTGLTVTAFGTSSVSLSWNAVAGATSYRLFRGTATGVYDTTVATGIAGTTYVDATVSSGTQYFYVVRAVTAGGAGADSNEVNPTTLCTAPTALGAVAASTTQINLSWTASAGATSYTIMRGTATGVYDTTVATLVAGTSYNDTGLTANTTYFYVVIAVNAGGNSSNSNEATTTTLTAAPTALNATPTSLPDVSLTWTGSAGALSYSVYRGPAGTGPFTLVQAGVPVTNYTDTTVANGTAYFYVVTATNAGGESANSTATGVTVQCAAPTALAGTSAAVPLRIDLTWAATPGAVTYTVLRGTSTGVHDTTVATLVATNSYSDTSVVVNTAYFYVVVAVNAGGNSPDSNEATATTPPAAPTSLAGTGSGVPQAVLTWNASAGATSYSLYNSQINGGPYTLVVNQPGTGYTDSGVVTGVTYYYVVKANGAGGASPNSNQATVAIPTAAPTAVAALSSNDPKITVSWNPVVGASTYNVKRSTVTGPPYVTIDTGIMGASYNDESVAANTTYFYVVSAVNGAGESANSGEASATTPPTQPTGLNCTPNTAGDVVLAWNATAGATSYTVSRGTNSNGPFTVVPLGSGIGGLNFTDTDATFNTNYYYVVSATSAAGTGKNCNAVAVTSLPPPPSGFTATAGNGQVGLSWAPVGGLSVIYNVYRGTSTTGPYGTTVASGLNVTSTTDSTVLNGTAYFYVVEAVNTAGAGAFANEASATPTAAVPSAPGGLFTTSGSGTVSLNWTAVGGATSYSVYRSTTSGGGYTSIATLVAINNYTDNTVANGTTYYYVVTAVNGGGESVFSSQASAMPQAIPPAPADLTATPGNTFVVLNWTSVQNAQYNVYQATAPGGPYGQIASNLVSTNMVVNSLTNGTPYYFVIRSVNASGESGNSIERTATPGPGPTVVTTNPSNYSTGISPGTHMVVTFSLPMNTATVAAATTLTPNPPFPLQFFWNGTNTQATIVFDTQSPAGIYGNDILAENTTYTVAISTAAQSGGGTPLTAAFSTSFTTAVDNTPPQVVSFTPNILTTAVPSATTQIDVLFNEDMNTSNGEVNLRISDNQEYRFRIGDPAGSITAAWLGDNRTFRITLQAGLLADSRVYTLNVGSMNDLANNFFRNDQENTLVTTGNGSDSTPPTVTGSYPANGATGISRDTALILGFSEAMMPDIANHIQFSANVSSIPLIKRYEGSPGIVMILPESAWPANTTFTATVDAGAKDSSGNAVSAPIVLTFTTGAGSGNPMVFDGPYSSIYDGIDSIEPNMFSQDSSLFSIAFKDSVTGKHAAVNGAGITSSDYSLVATSSGIPLKGYTVYSRRSRGLKVSFEGGRNFTGLQTSTSYTFTLNTTLQNSEGTPLAAPLAINFTTRAAGAQPSRPRLESVETQYTTMQGTPAAHQASLRINANFNAPITMTRGVTASDSVDGAFNPTFDLSSSWEARYESSGDEATLTTPGAHVVTYTVTGAPGGFTQSVKDDAYLFDTTLFPTLLGPGTIATSTPTYSWTSPATSGADGWFIQVSNVVTDEVMFMGITESNSLVHPSDHPLPSGTYSFTMILIKFQDGTFNGGEIPGMGMLTPLVFTVP